MHNVIRHFSRAKGDYFVVWKVWKSFLIKWKRLSGNPETERALRFLGFAPFGSWQRATAFSIHNNELYSEEFVGPLYAANWK